MRSSLRGRGLLRKLVEAVLHEEPFSAPGRSSPGQSSHPRCAVGQHWQVPREQGRCVDIPHEIKKAINKAKEHSKDADEVEGLMDLRKKITGVLDPGHHKALANAHADAHAHNDKVATTLHTLGVSDLAQKHRIQAAKHLAASNFHQAQAGKAAPRGWKDSDEAKDEAKVEGLQGVRRMKRLLESRRSSHTNA